MFLEPTRITASSTTCIDNIFCDRDPIDKNIISCLISNHCGQLVKLKAKGDKTLKEADNQQNIEPIDFQI